jgi:hypothetical protein
LLFAGINSNNFEYEVVQYVIQTELNGDEKRWEEEMWGFEETLSEKMFNEDIFREAEETGVGTQISRGNYKFDAFLAFILNGVYVFLTKTEDHQ